MLKEKKNKSIGKIFEGFLKLVLTLVLLIIVYFLVEGNIKLFYKNREVNNRYREFKTELEKVEKKNEELNKLFYQASQQEYIEKVIREKGLYKKPGEEVVVIEEE